MIAVVGAFVAGVLVTIGSLSYLRTQELNQFGKAVQISRPLNTAPPAVSAKPSTAGDADLQEGKPVAWPFHNIEPTSERARAIQVRKPPTQVPRSDKPTQRRSEIAQNTPGSNIAAPLTSAINESAQDALPQSISVPKPNVATLRAGTNVTIRLEESVSTERNRTGDRFFGTIDSPLVVNGLVLADRGATVSGQITKIKRARLLGGKSDLSLILTEITMSDGQRVHVETSPWEEKSAHNSIVETPRVAARAALGAVVGALSGSAKGTGVVSANDAISANNRNLLLTTGRRLTFQLARPVTITERLNYR
jgi:hypothetical protein